MWGVARAESLDRESEGGERGSRAEWSRTKWGRKNRKETAGRGISATVLGAACLDGEVPSLVEGFARSGFGGLCFGMSFGAFSGGQARRGTREKPRVRIPRAFCRFSCSVFMTGWIRGRACVERERWSFEAD